MRFIKTVVLIAFLSTIISSCEVSKMAKSDEKNTSELDMINQRVNERDEALRQKGADFVAFGTNPSWTLLVNKTDRIIEFQLEGKEIQKYFLNSEEYIEIHNIDVHNSNSNLMVNVIDENCTNTITGEQLAYQVTIDYNATTMLGCGKDLRHGETKTQIVPPGLNGAWSVETINHENVDYSDGVFQPLLDIKLKEMLMIGTTGCNNFQAEIIIEGNKMKFPPFPMTQKYCPNTIEGPIVQALEKVSRYDLQDKVLLLYDTEGKELLRLKKVD